MQITFRYFLNATYCPKINWQSQLKKPSSILETIENWESRRKDQESRIGNQGSRIVDWGTVNLLLSGTIYLSNFKALPSCYRKNLYLITWFWYSQRKYTLLYPLLLQFSERQQSPPTWKTCFRMTNICVSYRECLEKNNSRKCNNLTSQYAMIIFEIKWNWHTFDTPKRAICHIIRCSFQNMFIHHLKCVVISMFYSSWNN